MYDVYSKMKKLVPETNKKLDEIQDLVSEYHYKPYGSAYKYLQAIKKEYVKVSFENNEDVYTFNEGKKFGEVREYLTIPFSKFYFKSRGHWYILSSHDETCLKIEVLIIDSGKLNLFCIIDTDMETADTSVANYLTLFNNYYSEIRKVRTPEQQKSDKVFLVNDMKDYGEKFAEQYDLFEKRHLLTVLMHLSYINYKFEMERKFAELSQIDLEQGLKNDEIETENDEIEKPATKKVEKPKTNNSQKQLIIIGDLKIKAPKGSGITRTKILKRKCEVWGVRGHYRFYKSGKKVWIKPYKKGKKRNELDPKNKTYMFK